MKYQHLYKLIDNQPSTKIYRSENHLARLDFASNFVRVALYNEGEELLPTFSIAPGETKITQKGREKLSLDGFDLIVPRFEETANEDKYYFNNILLVVNKLNFQLSYYLDGKLLVSDRAYLAYNIDHELGNGTYHYLTREKDEHIYGLGDKTGNINKNGRRFRMETFDAMGYNAITSDPLYKQIPFYICKNSVGSYALYYDTYETSAFDFGSEINNYYDSFKYFQSNEESLVYYMMFGNVKSLVHDFAYLCGKNFFPPKWTLKYCASTMAYTDAPNAEEELRNFIDLLHKYDLDCGGFYLSSGYTQIGTKRYVFHWNHDKIKDPKKLSDYFKTNGIEFLPNIKPCFLTDHPLYQEIASKGWFLHYADGTPAIFPFWSGMGSYFDFTNPEAFAFWSDCVKKNLVDLGYKNIWNDNNEYDIHDPNVLCHGFTKEISATRIRPLFSYLMALASLQGQDTSSRYMAVTRSGIAGLQRICETWTGDNNTSFADFRGNHKIAMTLSLSGIYNFGQDIGGFAGPKPSKELFIRWLQYGVFTPRFTLHSWNPDGSSTMPWLYEDMMDEVKSIFKLREELLPYYYNNLYLSVQNYEPMIYPLFIDYPNYDEESDGFMVGKSMLALPIFDEGNTSVSINLPENNGGWYYNHHWYQGLFTITNTINDLPVYLIKGGSIIPRQKDQLIFEIYPKEEGTFSFDYFNDDGISKVSNANTLHIEVKCTKEEVIITNIRNNKVELIDNFKRKLILKNSSLK